MGKLRLISKKFKPDPVEYREYWGLIRTAGRLAVENQVIWDPDPGEDPNRARKCFLFVAEREGIDLRICRPRGTKSLQLFFREPAKQRTWTRAQYRECVLRVLGDHGRPMKRVEILRAGELPASGWYKNVQDLVGQGLLLRSGKLINTVYFLAE